MFSPEGTALVLDHGITTLTVGQLLSGNQSTDITVNQGDQIMMVFGAFSNGGTLVLAGFC